MATPGKLWLPDGRGLIPRKWRVDKRRGPVVLIAEWTVKALRDRRWPAVWQAVEVVDDQAFDDVVPVVVRIVCDAPRFDRGKFDQILADVVAGVSTGKRGLDPDDVRFSDNCLSLGAVYHVNRRGEIAPGAGSRLQPWAEARAKVRQIMGE